MIGNTPGHYQISSQFRKGGIGEVWKARDTRLDRIVAVKKAKEQHSERFMPKKIEELARCGVDRTLNLLLLTDPP